MGKTTRCEQRVRIHGSFPGCDGSAEKGMIEFSLLDGIARNDEQTTPSSAVIRHVGRRDSTLVNLVFVGDDYFQAIDRLTTGGARGE
jgi:hypothetical protein